MFIINGSLFGDVVQFHQPESHSSTVVIVIDEMNAKGRLRQLRTAMLENKAKKIAVVCSGTEVLAHCD